MGREDIRENGAVRSYTAHVAALNVDELLAAIRQLPLDERRRLIQRATDDVAQDTPKPGAVKTSGAPSLLGLMSDDPDMVDEVCRIAYEARGAARMRPIDE